MKQRLVRTLAVMILLLGISPGIALERPFETPPDAMSASHSEGAFSSLLNPAFSDFDDHSFLAYRLSRYDDQNDGNHFFMFKLLGFGFHYAWYDNVFNTSTHEMDHAGASVYNISKAFTYETLTFGAGYSFSRSGNDDFDNYKAWNLGFLFRPFRVLSLGMSFRDLGGEIGGKSINREEIYSISVRPYTDRVSLSVDTIRHKGDAFNDLDYTFGVEGRIVYDISLFFRADLDKNFLFGLTVPMFSRRESASTIMLDSYVQKGGKGRPLMYSFGVSLPSQMYKQALNPSPWDTLLVIRLNRTFEENEKTFLFQKQRIVFHDIIEGIRRAADDSSIRGIILEMNTPGLGFAQIQELRDDVKKFRNKGKKVYGIMKSIGNKEYYLACACDRIYFTPNSPFGLEGLSADVYFFKGLMDKVGVKYESIRHGKYKSFNEPFTRTDMSPEFRENMESLLSDLNNQFIDDIASDRSMDRAQVEKLLDKGIVKPEEARSMGFIDDVMYPEEARKQISSNLVEVRLGNYVSEKDKTFTWGPLPEIAVIYVNGTIVNGQSSDSFFMKNTGDDTYSSMLREVFTDDKVRAVVIRVDSGGGSASASDFMWKTLLELRKEYHKPVVFSFGNTAASGGYYIACTGDNIFASRGTVTGSIGVISGKINLKELYAKLGINKEVIKMNEFADIFNESRDLTERERELLQKSVDFIYDRFTSRVMEARNIEESEIPKLAEGRVFTGSQARDKNLVNTIGGLTVAIEYAASQAGLDKAEYAIRSLPDEKTYLKALLESNDTKVIARYIGSLVRHMEILQCEDEKVLMLCPYSIEIK